tara:strand:- start:199 stop:621 length:423 start_codon:yes stop_codon:yes gene_type:complete
MRNIDLIVVHCSATPEGKHFSTETIRNWHVNGNGWSDIGYHWVVELDGKVRAGRPEQRVGAHVKGYNRSSIGICYVGGMSQDMKLPKDTRSQVQRESLEQLLLELKVRYPKAIIKGHNDFSNKACPSFDAKEEYCWINEM